MCQVSTGGLDSIYEQFPCNSVNICDKNSQDPAVLDSKNLATESVFILIWFEVMIYPLTNHNVRKAAQDTKETLLVGSVSKDNKGRCKCSVQLHQTMLFI